ncbi:MAG: M4 family metallopeptidase [Bacteroidetes bacterium]|nr:M4 family metallopeptidase [Bacteroidota bacterium]
MKKRLLSLAMLGLALHGYAQNNLKSSIEGSGGITKNFVKLVKEKQVAFSPALANEILGLDNQSALVLKSSEKDNLGYTHYRFYQTYMGIPVNRSMYVVNVKDGKVVSMSGSIITDFSNNMSAKNASKISAKQAIENAIANVGATKYVWQEAGMEQSIKAQLKNPNASYYPVAEKCWYYTSDQIDPQNLVLAYKVDVFAEEPFSRAYYFINAASGKVIGREERVHTSDAVGTANTLYSGTQTIHSEQTGANAYRLHDLSRGNGVVTLHGNSGQYGVEYTNTSSNWNLSLPDQNAMDAHWGVEMTYDFYKANFNRNSIDNNGYALYSYVNRGGFLYNNNASWDGTAMNYGKRTNAGSQTGYGVTAIDVTGHELTHGVTQNTSALNYSGESGGMNESMSDIMGKSVQFYTKPNDIDWRLSNDMNWIIRDMSNPNAYQQPDTYGGTYWKANADVHILSGVGNFMFYLLVTGGSGTNDLGNVYSVQGLGLSKADQIIYRTETVYLTPNSKYADWRDACINAATDLYGASSNEVTQVENAWYAVGVGTAGGGGITYCTSMGQSTANEYIKRIVFNTIDNTSGDNGGYGDFTSISTNVTAGQTYTIKVQAGFTGATRKEGWTLYIDYNGDGDFNDANEKLGPVVINTANLVSKSFKIPATAKNGTTRMRIQMHYNTGITDPCATFDNGEVEDYTLNISGGSSLSSTNENLLSAVSVSPNPVVSSSMRLNYTLAKGGNITLRMTDANGIAQGNYKVGIQNKGANGYTISNLSSLHNGYYYVAVEQDGVAIGKITVLVAH